MEPFHTEQLAVPELVHLESRSRMEPNQKSSRVNSQNRSRQVPLETRQGEIRLRIADDNWKICSRRTFCWGFEEQMYGGKILKEFLMFLINREREAVVWNCSCVNALKGTVLHRTVTRDRINEKPIRTHADGSIQSRSKVPCKRSRTILLSLISSETLLSARPQRSKAKEFKKWALGSRSQTYSQTRMSEHKTDRSDHDHFSCMRASFWALRARAQKCLWRD